MIPKKCEEFCIESLGANDENISRITSYRHEVLSKSIEYVMQKKRIEKLIKNIGINQGDTKSLLSDLTDEILRMENLNYDQGYQDGMADLMTSITLNKAEITNVECIDWSAVDKENT